MKFYNINRKVIALMILSMSVFLSACFDDSLEGVNVDPQAATVADPATILPLIQVTLANGRTSELGIRASDIPEYIAQTFSGAAVGSPSPNQVGNSWVDRYESQLGNLEVIRLQTLEAGESSDAVRAVSIIFQQIAYMELTLLFEDIPFTESLNATEFPTPSFDTQETVLRGVVQNISDAKAILDNLSPGQVPIQGDLYFGGDITQWRKFATSLQIRALMLLRNRDTGVDAQLTQLFNDGPIETNDDVPMLLYVNSPANDNPYKQVIDDFFAGSNLNALIWSPRNTMVDEMNATNDPRRQLWFTTTTGGTYVGLTTRGFPADAATTSLLRDDNLLRGDLPDFLFTPAEIDLYQAELMLLGAIPGGVAGADEAYRRGTRLAVELWSTMPGAVDNLTDTQINDFIDGLPVLGSLNQQEALEAVYFQLYMDGFLRVIEGWTTVRRTGFPEIEAPPASTLTDYTRRFFYPVAEESANPNTPTSKALDVPHWFENN